MAKEHPFDKLGKGFLARATQRAESSYEEGRVDYLLKRFGLNARKVGNELREMGEGATGRYDLTFRAWNEMFPSFPLLLGAATLGEVKLHLDPKAMLPALYKEFSEAPFVRAYEDFYEANVKRARDRTVGLVFRRKGIRSGLIVYATNDLQDLPLAKREMLMAYAGGDKKDRHWMVVRSFEKVIDAIHNRGSGWTPSDG